MKWLPFSVLTLYLTGFECRRLPLVCKDWRANMRTCGGWTLGEFLVNVSSKRAMQQALKNWPHIVFEVCVDKPTTWTYHIRIGKEWSRLTCVFGVLNQQFGMAFSWQGIARRTWVWLGKRDLTTAFAEVLLDFMCQFVLKT